MLYEKNTFSLVLGDDMHIMGRRHVKDEELPRSFFCGSIDNELQGYRYPGLVPAYSFQRMARIVLYISLTAVFDPLSIENHFSRIAALLLQLLQVLSDDPVPSKVQGNKELVIAAETISRPPGGLIGLFHVLGFRPGTIMQAVQAEMEQTAIQACSLLENISKKRNVIIYEDALIDGKGLVTKYNVREIALKDFGNL
ncbi:MAG: hypothetical protein LQ352_004350 [Teloschistes flavicans]|nr:MAG: hypothetical protein LQ352_004350 [Teloschistes flavicans]